MKLAFRRLLVIFLFIVLGGVGSLFVLRQFGLQQRFAEMEHPLFRGGPWLIVTSGGGGEFPENSLVGFKALKNLDAKVFWGIDLRLTADNVWALYRPAYLEEQTEKAGLFKATNWKDIQQLDAGYRYTDENGEHSYRGKGLKVLSFEEFLKSQKSRPRLFINIHESRTYHLADLLKIIDSYPWLKQKIIFYSEQPGIISYLRQKEPLWVFGAGEIKLAQLRVFSALFIETLAAIKEDFFVIKNSDQPMSSITPRMCTEIHRRHRKIVIEVDEKPQSWLNECADGFMTNRPSQVQSLLR